MRFLERRFQHHPFRRIPLIVYASDQDFEQTNIFPGFIPEGVLGFTEYLKRRVALPFRGDYDQFLLYSLPDEAAVDRMRLHIGDRFIEGEIREKEQAKKEYEQAKQAGKKTSLVEQQRANLFRTSVANIGPGESVIVEIEYLETVRYSDGTFSLRFPMTLTPRYVSGSALPDRQGNGWSPDTDRVPDASMITPPQVTASKNHRIALVAEINSGMPLEIIASL